ncbi:hypothetical protein K438DRAFT_1861789 [Mycena galopus ATCC 62051]|nr:hypothetical protein K438DRAFT_1879897 [Mycena galopus ATCC 62051]KAF8157385.1 hypothetical protein K438DRAFT_1861789 [Mycena galopus ATCC 62051]
MGLELLLLLNPRLVWLRPCFGFHRYCWRWLGSIPTFRELCAFIHHPFKTSREFPCPWCDRFFNGSFRTIVVEFLISHRLLWILGGRGYLSSRRRIRDNWGKVSKVRYHFSPSRAFSALNESHVSRFVDLALHSVVALVCFRLCTWQFVVAQ